MFVWMTAPRSENVCNSRKEFMFGEVTDIVLFSASKTGLACPGVSTLLAMVGNQKVGFRTHDL